MSAKNNHKRHPRGITLLLSVLILSIVASVALGVTFLIIRQLQQGGDVKAEITAQNQADTGVENVLYQAKLARGSGTDPDTFASDLSNNKFPCSSGSAQTPTFCVNTVAGTLGEKSITTSLAQDQSTSVDFYDSKNLSSVNVQAIQLSGHADLNTWLEVSWVGWTTLGGQINFQSSSTKVFFSGSEIAGVGRIIYLILGSFNGTQETFFLNDPLKYGNCNEASALTDPTNDCLVLNNHTPMNYIVRIKALYGSVPYLNIQGLNSNDPLNDCTKVSCTSTVAQTIPSRASLKVIGKSLAVQQALQVSIPWRTSLAGLYDYVLFSANSLNRSESVAPNFYTSGPQEAEQGATIAQSNGSVCATVGTVCSPWVASAFSSNALCYFDNTINASGSATCKFTGFGKIVFPLTNLGLTDTSGYSYLNYRVRVRASASNEKITFSIGDSSGSTLKSTDTFDETAGYPPGPKDPQGNQSVDGWETCTNYAIGPKSTDTLVVQPNSTDLAATPQFDWFSLTSYPIVTAGTCSYSSN